MALWPTHVNAQLHKPCPTSERPLPAATVLMLAVEEMFTTLPGSRAVASFSRRFVRLYSLCNKNYKKDTHAAQTHLAVTRNVNQVLLGPA